MPKMTKPNQSPRSFTLGRGHFEKISAVEGIRLSRGLRADFEEFDRLGVPADERRRVLMMKYGRSV